MAVEISFPNAVSSDANLFASELRRDLTSEGIAPAGLSIHRVDTEAMDMGSLLVVGQHAIEGVVAAHALFTMAQTLVHFAKRNRCIVKVKSTRGNVSVEVDKIDPDSLAALLKNIAEVSRDESSA